MRERDAHVVGFFDWLHARRTHRQPEWMADRGDALAGLERIRYGYARSCRTGARNRAYAQNDVVVPARRSQRDHRIRRSGEHLVQGPIERTARTRPAEVEEEAETGEWPATIQLRSHAV